jgi:predicted Zn-dependent peptidase
VIIEEMNMYEDMPNRRVHELFQNLLYGDQPAGWDIIGTKDVVRRVGRDDFADYRTKRYTPQNTIVIVAGGFDIKSARKMVQKSFGVLPSRKSPKKPKTLDYSPKEKISIKYKESDQTHLVLGVPGLNAKDPRRFALEVAMEILGGGMSSRLFYRIREELGAAYYIRAGASFSADHGSVAVWSGADNKRVHQVLSVISEEIKKLLNEKVGIKELQKAKDHLTGGLILSLETADHLAGFYAFQEMVSGDVLSPEEIVKKVQAVTPSQVQAIVKSLFKEPLRLAVIGPWKEKKDFAKILSI